MRPRPPPRPPPPPQDLWDKPAGGLEKGSARGRRSGGGAAVRTALVLLAGAAVFAVGLQWQPAYSNIVQQLRMSANTDLTAWAPGSGGSSYRAAVRGARPGDEAQAVGERFLSLEVCGDPATQRIALLSGEPAGSKARTPGRRALGGRGRP